MEAAGEGSRERLDGGGEGDGGQETMEGNSGDENATPEDLRGAAGEEVQMEIGGTEGRVEPMEGGGAKMGVTISRVREGVQIEGGSGQP